MVYTKWYRPSAMTKRPKPKGRGFGDKAARYAPAPASAPRTAKLFRNGRSQAVRLPKEFRFEGDEVYVKREGESLVLIPKNDPWVAVARAYELVDPKHPIRRPAPRRQKRTFKWP
jgi:antitoxin VapB